MVDFAIKKFIEAYNKNRNFNLRETASVTCGRYVSDY